MVAQKLFVGGIPAANANAEQVKELFTEHGVVPVEVAILPAKGSNPETRCGFVRVPEEAVVSICQTLNGLHFEGHTAPLVVRPADTQAKQQQSHAGVGAVPLKLHAIASLGAGPLGQETPASPVLDPTVEKERAKAEGRWIDAAQWQDQERRRAGETTEAKFQRLSSELQEAVMSEHFYEAAAVFEIMAGVDAEAAASANAAAAAACAGSGVDQSRGPGSRGPYSGQADGDSMHTFVGTVLTFQPDRHFGFIQCPDLGCDAFVSDKQIGSFNVGDRVAFNFHPLHHGDVISIEGATLTAYHTPGHAMDHCSYWLQEDKSLFSGDHVLGWGTTFMMDLYEYMNTLQFMIALRPIHLYPGHGPMIEDAMGLLERYIMHRKEREDQVEDVLLQRTDPVSVLGVVHTIYTNTPPERLWMAQENVQKILRKFERAGVALAFMRQADGTLERYSFSRNWTMMRRLPEGLVWLHRFQFRTETRDSTLLRLGLAREGPEMPQAKL